MMTALIVAAQLLVLTPAHLHATGGLYAAVFNGRVLTITSRGARPRVFQARQLIADRSIHSIWGVTRLRFANLEDGAPTPRELIVNSEIAGTSCCDLTSIIDLADGSITFHEWRVYVRPAFRATAHGTDWIINDYRIVAHLGASLRTGPIWIFHYQRSSHRLVDVSRLRTPDLRANAAVLLKTARAAESARRDAALASYALDMQRVSSSAMHAAPRGFSRTELQRADRLAAAFGQAP